MHGDIFNTLAFMLNLFSVGNVKLCMKEGVVFLLISRKLLFKPLEVFKRPIDVALRDIV